MEIWRTRPHVQVQKKVTATCGLCGDKSFMQVIAGGFHMASIEGGRVRMVNNNSGTITEENGMPTIPLTIITEKK